MIYLDFFYGIQHKAILSFCTRAYYKSRDLEHVSYFPDVFSRINYFSISYRLVIRFSQTTTWEVATHITCIPFFRFL